MKFQGDVRGARLYRSGVEVESIRGGHGPQKVKVDDGWIELKDVTDVGYYVLPPEVFAPDSTGAPPVVTVTIQDLKNPNFLSVVDIWGDTSARVWNDFGPSFTAVAPDRPFQPANPALKPPKVRLECDPPTGACKPRP